MPDNQQERDGEGSGMTLLTFFLVILALGAVFFGVEWLMGKWAKYWMDRL